MIKNFKTFIRTTAAVTGLAMLCTLGTAGFYERTLPDSYHVDTGGTLMLDTFFKITADQKPDTCTVALREVSGSSVHASDARLMLFNSIPVKSVTSTAAPRPKLVPCGETFGIKLLTDGVIVADLSKVGKRCPASECGIRKGDIIISINGEIIRSNSDAAQAVKASRSGECKVRLRREGVEQTLTLIPEYSEGSYKAGMWVRDSSAGIGTLTFYNEATGTFGGLGHPVCDADTKELLPLSQGAVGDIKITGMIPSSEGSPGQLLGEFSGSKTLGEITLNCEDGLFGRLFSPPDDKQAVELAYKQEVKCGAAQIFCSLDGQAPKAYSVEIESIDLSDDAVHDMVIHVTDRRLLDAAGGIVQGMSGSPVIQNGRLAGAVTHVFIDDPTRGYGIFAEEMAKH
ncbi:MAG: SpoIVB peptidase [Ruminococcus sp.]|nr:SpoIVB peptidase [Ruminococcus sp.]